MYKVELTKPARREYSKLPEKTRQSVFEKLTMLAKSPFAPQLDVKKLQGEKNCYRLRIGDWRVIYRLQNPEFVIEVIRIAHRKEAYR